MWNSFLWLINSLYLFLFWSLLMIFFVIIFMGLGSFLIFCFRFLKFLKGFFCFFFIIFYMCFFLILGRSLRLWSLLVIGGVMLKNWINFFLLFFMIFLIMYGSLVLVVLVSLL